MKKVNIYLIANENEVLQDGKEISNFVRDLNDKFCEDNIYFKLITDREVENMEIAEKEIKNSEMFFILFCKDIDSKVIDKFNLAYDNFVQSYSPKISTYIKETTEKVEKSVSDFMAKLGDELGHYYSLYNNVDTIKLNIVLKLKALGLSASEIVTNDGKLYINDAELLDLKNIPIIFNNRELAKFKEELDKLEDRYIELNKRIKSGDEEKDTLDEFASVDTRRKEVKDKIFELEKNIIDLESSFVKISSEGRLSKRQIYAQECLEKGDIETAKEILNVDVIKEEVEKKLELRDLRDEDIKVNINELIQRINTLELDVNNKDRFSEIEKCYDIAVEIERKVGTYPKALAKFVIFLTGQNKETKALEMGERYLKYIEYKNEIENIYDVVNTYDSMSICCLNSGDVGKQDEYIQKVFEYIEKIDNKKTKARLYHNIAVVKLQTGRYKEAEEFFKKSLEIRESLENETETEINNLILNYKNLINTCISTKNTAEVEEYISKIAKEAKKLDRDKVSNKIRMAGVFHQISRYYSLINNYEKAIKYVEEAIRIYEDNLENDPQEYGDFLIYAYENFANIKMEMQEYDIAEEILNKALSLLEKRNEVKINELIDVYCQLYSLYKKQKIYDKAEENIDIAIKYAERYAKQKYGFSDLANAYMYKSDLCEELKEYDKAKELFEKSIEILKEKDNVRCKKTLVNCYRNLAYLYEKYLKEYGLAEEYYAKAIDVQTLIVENEDNNVSTKKALSNRYNDLGNLYLNNNNYEKAFELYNKSIEICEELYNYAPNANKEEYADVNNYVGLAYYYMKDYVKAEDYLKKAVELYKEIITQSDNPVQIEVFNRTIATYYNNLGNCYKELKEYTKAEECYRAAIQIREKIVKENIENTKNIWKLHLVYGNLAELYEILERYEEAIKVYNQRFEYRDILNKLDYEKYEPTFINSYFSISEAYRKLKDYDKLEEYRQIFNELKNKWKVEHGTIDEKQARYSRDEDLKLANIYMEDEIYDKAEQIFINIIEKNANKNDRESLDLVSDCYENLAIMCVSQERYEEAVEFYNRQEIVIAKLMEFDKTLYTRILADLYNVVGNLYYNKYNDYLNAAEYYTKVINLYENIKDLEREDYDKIAKNYYNLNLTSKKLNREKDYEKGILKSAEYNEKLVNIDYDKYILDFKNACIKVANYYIEENKYKVAEEWFKKVIKYLEQSEDAKYIKELIDVYKEFVKSIYYKQKAHIEVAKVYEKVIELYKKLDENSNVINIYNCHTRIGFAYADKKMYDKSMEHLKIAEDMFETFKDKIKDSDKSKARLYYKIAEIYYHQKSYEKAKEYIDVVMQILEKLNEVETSKYDPELFEDYGLALKIYFKLKMFDEMEEINKKFLAINKRLNSSNSKKGN